MILAIDAGNTRIKWGLFDSSGQMRNHGVAAHGQLAAQAGLWCGCRLIVAANVAGQGVAAELQALSAAQGLPLRMVTATETSCGVSNGYARPEQLGPDRWASLIAAWHEFGGPCVVATAGTALTVDALSAHGEFLGGLIVPGWHLMRSALATGTAGLNLADGALQAFPTNTADAIHSGACLAMAGAVAQVHAALQQREGRLPGCILSGGDAQLLQSALSVPARIVEPLVLKGLYLIARERA